MALAVGVKIIHLRYRLYSNGVDHYWVRFGREGTEGYHHNAGIRVIYRLYTSHAYCCFSRASEAFRWRGRLVGEDVN